MSEIDISVPITGPGSQPVEDDGVELDILQMPSGMETYVTPILPEPEEVEDLKEAKTLLSSLIRDMQEYRVGMPNLQLPLDSLDTDNLELIDQVLGEGEVSIVVDADVEVRIQESVLAGIWRIKYLDAGKLLRDQVEVGDIPNLIKHNAFTDAKARIDVADEAISEGVLNAPPLIAEINDKIAAFRKNDETHVINLTLLPQTEADLHFLSDQLGTGTVTILSRGYGNCRITSTATKLVWWVQYFNSQDKNILNTLEISQVPVVACAAQEDIEDSHKRLLEILDTYL